GQPVKVGFANLLDLPRPAPLITDVLDHQQGSKVALEVGRFLKLAREAHAAMRSHSDLLPKLAQHSVARVLVRAAAAARQAPAGCVAQSDEDDPALRSECEGV